MLPLLLHVLLAAGPGPSDALSGAPVATDRIESIAVDMAGQAATLVTRAIALDGGRSSFVLGGKACREHKLEPAVLEQMFAAMHARLGVRVAGIAVGRGEQAVQCLAAITFFAPGA
ncbi:MAG: hypothetical protein IAG13_22550 [Deltaproteobacteria bacterium]|nr:hypothetical protein [Nannocystaceae bacterium]